MNPQLLRGGLAEDWYLAGSARYGSRLPPWKRDRRADEVVHINHSGGFRSPHDDGMVAIGGPHPRDEPHPPVQLVA